MASVKLDENVPDSLDRDFTNILWHPPEATAGIVVIRLPQQTLPIMRQAANTLGDVLSRESARRSAVGSRRIEASDLAPWGPCITRHDADAGTS